MASTLDFSAGNEAMPGYSPLPLKWPKSIPDYTEYNPLATWPYNSPPLASQPRKVQPSFSTSGIPGGGAATPPAVVNPFASSSANSGSGQTITTPGQAMPSAPSSANPFFTVSTTKNPVLEQTLSGLLGQFNKVAQVTPEDFTTALNAAKPQFNQLTQQDIGAAGDFFNGTAQARLDKLRADRHSAVRAAADRALGDLTRILSLGNMGQGGGSTTGTSSYIQKLGLNNATGVETQAAVDDANQARADEEYLNAAKLGLLGKRGDILQTDVNRSLLPSQANAQWFQSLVSGLTPLTATSSANDIYGVEGPGGYVGDTFSGLQAARLGDLNRIQSGQLGLQQNQIAQQNANTAAQQGWLRTILGIG